MTGTIASPAETMRDIDCSMLFTPMLKGELAL